MVSVIHELVTETSKTSQRQLCDESVYRILDKEALGHHMLNRFNTYSIVKT